MNPNLMILTAVSMGCQASVGSRLTEANQLLAEEQFYQARQITQTVLEDQPQNAEAQYLMAEIIDAEIARHSEFIGQRPLEEMTEDETSQAVKLWLERSKTLLSLGQFDQAMLAAEKVFIYDLDNQRASQLIDRIRKQAVKDGKAESLIVKRMYQREMGERVAQYRVQAKEWIEMGRWGAARLTVEKILLLAPDDSEANRMYMQIKERRALR